MFRRAVIVAIAFTALAASASAARWEVDKTHSSVNFTVKHLVVSKVNGKFDDFAGSIEWNGSDFKEGQAELTVQMASVDTDNEKRDGHVKSPDFFDAEKYPTMSFKSKKLIPGDPNYFQLIGDLTIRDVTKEVTFNCEYNGQVDFMNTTKAGFSAWAEIDRQEFGVSFSKSLDTGGLVVSNSVKITLELELNKVTELSQP